MQDTSGLWEEHIHPETGESSLTEYIVPKVVKKYCSNKEHTFVFVSSRELECSKCGIGSRFIPGKHKLVDGKLLPV